MVRNPSTKSARQRFAELLARHLRDGTRPQIAASATIRGEPWTDAEFAASIISSHTIKRGSSQNNISDRTVANWRNGTSLPNAINPILITLFGYSGHHAVAREKMRAIYDSARVEKHSSTIRRAREPTAQEWQPIGDRLVAVHNIQPSDEAAAADPLRQQQQSQIINFAAELIQPGMADTLANSPIWKDLNKYATSFHNIVACEPKVMPARLGTAYGLLFRLVAFINTNMRVQSNPETGEFPLPLEIQGALETLIRVASPWLCGFPTVATWDEAAGRYLTRVDHLLPTAREFVRSASQRDVISEADAREVETLAEAADAGGYTGQKAGNRAIGYANNLMFAFAEIRSNPDSISPLLNMRINAVLADPGAHAQDLIAAQPKDVSEALDAILSASSDVAGSSTEAEEALELLRLHAAAHDETLNHLTDGVAIFGSERRLTYRNTAFQILFDLDPAWLAERPTHGELLDRLRQRRHLPETAEYSKFKARELEFYGSAEVAPDDLWSLPDGRTLRVVRQPHPLGGLLLLFSDITDELKLRAQYNALIQVQRATLDKLNDAVAVFGSDGRLRLHNEAFEQLWDVGAQALQDAGDFDGVAGLCRPLLRDAALWSELKARVVDPDPQARVPISGEAKTSDQRTFTYQTRPLPDGATLVAFDDVTARHELEKALIQRSEALAETEQLKREFVGNVSYELRTPLTSILGYTELLDAERDNLSPRARAYLDSIRANSESLAKSVNDALDMAEIDAREMALQIGEVDVAEALQAAAVRARPRMAAHKVELVVEGEVKGARMRADPRRLGQILDHLLDNAARSTPAGGKVVLAADGSAGEVRIRVSDTGRGIPYHQQAHVFDRFVGRERGGPGLGLALVKALVELHGGWIELQSEPGAGATFLLHLPTED